ncbi:deoxyhypusine synthase [archaeon]|nr:deoxyhypusine synthase [archaeon]|tara:strand:+ start:1241 stop:2161 length:921 start_codon:yes stop_codon:yes gene_type:complete
MKPVKQIKISGNLKVNDLIKEMANVGVMGSGNLGKAVDALELMINDKECKVFFGVAGAMIPGGMQNVIIDFLDNKYVDVFVTTGAMLTHDLVEGLGYNHIQGNEKMDDAELNKKGLVRMYDSLMQNSVYERLEVFFEDNFEELSKAKNIKEFLNILGKVSPENTVLHTCYKNKIPIYCPAIADSGIGLMIWGKLAKGMKINIDAFDDLKEILDTAWTSKKSGVFYVSGGVPKNFIQQAMQFSKEAKYAVQITTDVPNYGGSSGAPLNEGISWGKLDESANYVDLKCDSTIALPIILAALKDRIGKV